MPRLLEPGQLLRETYEVERFLGEGAFAEVHRVRHRFLGRQAIKVFKRPGATLEEIERDLSEATLLSSLGHPNIVRVYDANVLDLAGARVGYFTMTYVSGGSLHELWRSHGANLMPVPTVVDIVRQAARGLSVAHAANPPIVHRDIKPQNVLIGYGADGLQARLSDFGLAKHVNPLTMLVSAQGTLGFKPPEAFENMDSPSADIWAMGTTLYLLLTDRLPFPHLNERDLEDGRCFLRPLRAPSVFNIDVDTGLESIVYRCLAAEPGDRYADAGDLLEDLERWSPGSGADVALVSRTGLGAKNALGAESNDPERDREREREARERAREAVDVAREPTRLVEAADLLEEALNHHPGLRAEFEGRLKLWRRGVSM